MIFHVMSCDIPSDAHDNSCDVMSWKVCDLQECLREKAEAEEQTSTLISEKTKQWEVR